MYGQAARSQACILGHMPRCSGLIAGQVLNPLTSSSHVWKADIMSPFPASANPDSQTCRLLCLFSRSSMLFGMRWNVAFQSEGPQPKMAKLQSTCSSSLRFDSQS
jgi:hypothetical protein